MKQKKGQCDNSSQSQRGGGRGHKLRMRRQEAPRKWKRDGRGSPLEPAQETALPTPRLQDFGALEPQDTMSALFQVTTFVVLCHRRDRKLTTADLTRGESLPPESSG